MHSMFINPVGPSDVLLATYNLKPKLNQGYDDKTVKGNYFQHFATHYSHNT